MAMIHINFFVLMVLSVIATGCGGGMPMGKVTGKVTFKGRPVGEGTVRFQPKLGPAAAGPLSSDGSYELTTKTPHDGTVVGSHTVTIQPLMPFNMDMESRKIISKPKAIPIPEKYRDPATSGLTAEVKSGQNEVNFEIGD